MAEVEKPRCSAKPRQRRAIRSNGQAVLMAVPTVILTLRPVSTSHGIEASKFA